MITYTVVDIDDLPSGKRYATIYGIVYPADGSDYQEDYTIIKCPSSLQKGDEMDLKFDHWSYSMVGDGVSYKIKRNGVGIYENAMAYNLAIKEELKKKVRSQAHLIEELKEQNTALQNKLGETQDELTHALAYHDLKVRGSSSHDLKVRGPSSHEL